MRISVIRMFLPIDFNSDKYHDEKFLHLTKNIIFLMTFFCLFEYYVCTYQ